MKERREEQRQELNLNRRNTAYWLAPMASSACFLIHHRTSHLGMGRVAYNGLGPLTSAIIKAAGQPDGGSPLIKDPSSQVTLLYVKLTQRNKHSVRVHTVLRKQLGGKL